MVFMFYTAPYHIVFCVLGTRVTIRFVHLSELPIRIPYLNTHERIPVP